MMNAIYFIDVRYFETTTGSALYLIRIRVQIRLTNRQARRPCTSLLW